MNDTFDFDKINQPPKTRRKSERRVEKQQNQLTIDRNCEIEVKV
jgi:hypothetical protein